MEVIRVKDLPGEVYERYDVIIQFQPTQSELSELAQAEEMLLQIEKENRIPTKEEIKDFKAVLVRTQAYFLSYTPDKQKIIQKLRETIDAYPRNKILFRARAIFTEMKGLEKTPTDEQLKKFKELMLKTRLHLFHYSLEDREAITKMHQWLDSFSRKKINSGLQIAACPNSPHKENPSREKSAGIKIPVHNVSNERSDSSSSYSEFCGSPWYLTLLNEPCRTGRE